MGAGYPIAIILKNDRKRYYRVLQLAYQGEYKPLCEFIARAVLHSVNLYLNILKPTKSKDKMFISLKELAKDSPCSADHLRKLATLGKIEAYKEGHN